MNTADVLGYLDTILPDKQVVADVANMLNLSEGEASVELENLQVSIPTNATIEVVTKALFKDDHETGFGTYKAQVAIGGIKQASGVTTARYCFATLYYNAVPQLITADFHRNMR